ncbi:MAG: ABC transporter ATP-binding protein [Pseudomonadota bacterium]
MSALLELNSVRVEFTARGIFGDGPRVVAVDDASLTVGRGEIVALIGASGSGKTTTMRAALGLQPINSGEILLSGQALGKMTGRAHKDLRRRVQLIFQDPTEALNPRMTVEEIMREGLSIHHIGATVAERRKLIAESLGFVGLTPPGDFLARHPHRLSGGQRQRVAIAAALVLSPDLLIADEPVSMLDPSIRAGILDLFARLRTERQMSTLMVTHDLPSAYHLADRVYVMNKGRIVEHGATRAVFRAPRHDYTKTLIRAASGRPVA